MRGDEGVEGCACEGTYMCMYVCAGPLQETIGDFWQMVWDENVRTIVMLTNTQEKGKVRL